jgi:hypothetical protein
VGDQMISVGTKIYKQKRLAEMLRNKYGKELLNDIKLVKIKPFMGLTDIASKYGFSRERARQIYTGLSGEKYSLAKKRKKESVNEEVKSLCSLFNINYKLAEYNHNSSSYKGVIVEKIFYDECQKRNIAIKFPNSCKVDLIANGYKIEVKSYQNLFKNADGIRYERFSLTPKQNKEKNFDFLACYSKIKKGFYIIPRERIRGCTIYFRVDKIKKKFFSKRNNNFDYCFERWEYLFPEDLEPPHV